MEDKAVVKGHPMGYFFKGQALLAAGLVLWLAPVWGQVQDKAIYGLDDRQEYFQVPKNVQQTAAAVAALFYAPALPTVGKTYQIPPTPYRFSLWEHDYPLCAGERYAKQPSAAYCSGALIAPDQVLTAAHCAQDPQTRQAYQTGKPCAGIVLAFDYRVEAAGKYPTQLLAPQLYQCEKVLDYYYQDNRGFQLVVLQLDRQVADRTPLPIRSSGKIADGASLAIIGYPLGWPMKIALTGASVRDNHADDAFLADVDSFHGNSGSPIFDAEQLQQGHAVIEGVLVSGETDFIVTEQSCATANACKTQQADELGCHGEKIMRVNKPLLSQQ